VPSRIRVVRLAKAAKAVNGSNTGLCQSTWSRYNKMSKPSRSISSAHLHSVGPATRPAPNDPKVVPNEIRFMTFPRGQGRCLRIFRRHYMSRAGQRAMVFCHLKSHNLWELDELTLALVFLTGV